MPDTPEFSRDSLAEYFLAKSPEKIAARHPPMEGSTYAEKFQAFSDLEEGDSLLDMGTGSGTDARHLSDKYDVTSVDFLREMLGYSEAQENGQKVEYVQADTGNLPFQDESFDAVFVPTAAHTMPEEADEWSDEELYGFHREILGEAARMVKEGGTILAGFEDTEQGAYETNQDAEQAEGSNPTITYCRTSETEIERLAEDLDLEIEQSFVNSEPYFATYRDVAFRK